MFKKIKDALIFASLTYAAVITLRGFGELGREIVEYRKNRKGYYKK